MAFSVKVGTFTRKSANPGTGSQAVTGVGFQPKALILYFTYQTATGFQAFQSGGIGFASSSTTERYIAWAADDNVATSNTGAGQGDNLLKFYSAGTPTTESVVNLTSFDSDGFTLDWATNPNDASAIIINYVALGGSDLTNAFSGRFDGPTSGSTGNRSYTGVGFQGDFAIFMAGGVNATFGDTPPLCFGFGAAASSTQRGATMCAAADANTMSGRTEQFISNSKCYLLYGTGNPPAINQAADFVSFDSDGFTLNHTTVSSGGVDFMALVLKGGQYDVVNFTSPNGGTPPVSQDVTAAFQGRGALIFGADTATLDSEVVEANFEIGASDGTNEGTVWSSSDDTATTATNNYLATDKVIAIGQNPTTVNSEADLTAFNSGNFNLSWTTIDASQRRLHAAVFGDNAVAGLPPKNKNSVSRLQPGKRKGTIYT